jgi:hypothetical protein
VPLITLHAVNAINVRYASNDISERLTQLLSCRQEAFRCQRLLIARGLEPQQTRSNAPVRRQSLDMVAKLSCRICSEVSNTGINKNVLIRHERRGKCQIHFRIDGYCKHCEDKKHFCRLTSKNGILDQSEYILLNIRSNSILKH